jgi:putative exosortase-associated protein (TIGR04073 family)
MKKLITVTLALCMTLSVFAAEETVQTEEVQPAPQQNWLDSMAHSMGRGFVNCLTCWVELPRNLWYDNVRMPIVGMFPGLISGTCLTGARALGGVTDVISFGLTGPGIYTEKFPEYVWHSPWQPEDHQIMLKNKPIQ